jgi:hypothetical protein
MAETLWVGTRKGLVKYVNAGKDWQYDSLNFRAEPVSMLLDAGGGTVYCALNLGHFGPKLHRSDDNGASWTEITVPAFSKTEGEGEEKSDGEGEKDKGKSVEQVFCLEKGHADGELWAGTIPVGLFHSTDKGETWRLVNSLTDMPEAAGWFGGGTDKPALHSICLNDNNKEQLRIAISCGGVWQSNDNGKTWESRAKGMRAEYMPPDQAYDPNIQDPHCLQHSPADPENLWVQHHNGIFHSTNGGAEWTEIDKAGPSTFGFVVAVHPGEPDTAWFVPGVKDECRMPVNEKLVVTRTRDGGRSFDVLDNGLPDKNCFDLVYRHGMDIDASGNRLAMGSTTGNLWISEDQGDSWTELSHNLANIYCVKFAP